MKRRDFNKNMVLLGLTAPLVSSGLSSFASVAKRGKYEVTIGESQEAFPAGSQAVTVKTNPVFVLTHNNQTEVLVFKADLKYTTQAPKKDRQGFKFTDVELQDWRGTAHSKLLGKEVSFKATNSGKSQIKSLYLNQDFPSNLQLNVEFDVHANGQLVQQGLTAKANTTLKGFVPEAKNLFQVDGMCPNIGRNNDIDLLFLSA